MVLFAFRNSTSEQAEDGIIETLHNIRASLDQLEKDVQTLESSWTATEADQYYASVRNFRQGADEISSFLNVIEGKLSASRVAINELRASIARGLQS